MEHYKLGWKRPIYGGLTLAPVQLQLQELKQHSKRLNKPRSRQHKQLLTQPSKQQQQQLLLQVFLLRQHRRRMHHLPQLVLPQLQKHLKLLVQILAQRILLLVHRINLAGEQIMLARELTTHQPELVKIQRQRRNQAQSKLIRHQQRLRNLQMKLQKLLHPKKRLQKIARMKRLLRTRLLKKHQQNQKM